MRTRQRPASLCGLPAIFSLVMAGCGGGGGNAPTAAPSISAQPSNQDVVCGQQARFTVEAGGNPAPAFAWERSQDQGRTWSAVPGAASGTLVFNVQKVDGGAWFRATATNSQGSATSASAALTVEPVVVLGGIYQAQGTAAYASGTWTNGVWTPLPSLDPRFDTKLTSISAVGGSLYATGWGQPGAGNTQACYWKDGALAALPATGPFDAMGAAGLAVDGNDLYVVGSDNGHPGYWLNGLWTSLYDPYAGASIGGGANAIALVGGRPIIGGSVQATGGFAPALWQDGAWSPLPDGGFPLSWSGYPPVFVHALLESDGDVYAAGACAGPALHAVPCYWKNGALVTLPSLDPTRDAYADAIAVSGGDVYVAGSNPDLQGEPSAGYWKNGAWTPLPTPYFFTATGMATAGADVYLAGFLSWFTPSGSIGGQPGWWKNGTWTPVTVPDEAAPAYASGLVLLWPSAPAGGAL